jgi:hypothetical protein
MQAVLEMPLVTASITDMIGQYKTCIITSKVVMEDPELFAVSSLLEKLNKTLMRSSTTIFRHNSGIGIRLGSPCMELIILE